MRYYDNYGKLEHGDKQVNDRLYMQSLRAGFGGASVCVLAGVNVFWDHFAKNQRNRTKLSPRRSQWRADLHIHLSFKATVNESHLIISPERIYNFGRGAYSIAAFVKNLSV